MSQLLTLFARKEPTRDRIDIDRGMGHRQDTVLYRDAACTTPMARWPWHYTSCPRRGQKRVTLNCCNWALAWVD